MKKLLLFEKYLNGLSVRSNKFGAGTRSSTQQLQTSFTNFEGFKNYFIDIINKNINVVSDRDKELLSLYYDLLNNTNNDNDIYIIGIRLTVKGSGTTSGNPIINNNTNKIWEIKAKQIGTQRNKTTPDPISLNVNKIVEGIETYYKGYARINDITRERENQEQKRQERKNIINANLYNSNQQKLTQLYYNINNNVENVIDSLVSRSGNNIPGTTRRTYIAPTQDSRDKYREYRFYIDQIPVNVNTDNIPFTQQELENWNNALQIYQENFFDKQNGETLGYYRFFGIPTGIIYKQANDVSICFPHIAEPLIDKLNRRSLGNSNTTQYPPMNITIDLYKIFLENNGLIDTFNENINIDTINTRTNEIWGFNAFYQNNINPQFIKKQVKWLLCYAMNQIYIDPLHDFNNNKSTMSNKRNFKAYKKSEFDKYILFLYNTFYLRMGFNEFVNVAAEALGRILEIDTKNTTDTNVWESPSKWFRRLPDGSETNIFSEVEVFQYYTEAGQINRQRQRKKKKNSSETYTPTYSLNTQDQLVVCSEYLSSIMGVQKIYLDNLQNTIVRDTNNQYHDYLAKTISLANTNEVINQNDLTSLISDPGALPLNSPILNHKFQYTVGVDALSKPSNRLQMTSILKNTLSNVTYIESSIISEIDGASVGNPIRSQIPTRITVNSQTINFNIKFSTLFADDSIINYTISKNQGSIMDMTINKYFNIIQSDIENNNSLDARESEIFKDDGNTISIESINSKINENDNFMLTIFKTLLDLCKIAFFHTILNDPTFRLSPLHMFFFNDVLAANIGANFIRNVVIEETGETKEIPLDERPYWLFLRTFTIQRIRILKGFPVNYIRDPKNIGAFGKKKNKKFIQEANKRSQQKGTVGLFGKWCRSKGLATTDGKVTMRCINAAKKSGNVKIVRRAVFAQNIGGYAGATKKKSSFGKGNVQQNIQNILVSFEKYLNSI